MLSKVEQFAFDWTAALINMNGEEYRIERRIGISILVGIVLPLWVLLVCIWIASIFQIDTVGIQLAAGLWMILGIGWYLIQSFWYLCLRPDA